MVTASSINRIVLPRLEFLTHELIERSDLIDPDKKTKALTFLHISLVKLLSQISLESQEFVKFSSITWKKPKHNIDLVIFKKLAKGDKYSLELFLTQVMQQVPLVIKIDDKECHPEILVNFLEYIRLPNVTLSILLKEDLIFINNKVCQKSNNYVIRKGM